MGKIQEIAGEMMIGSDNGTIGKNPVNVEAWYVLDQSNQWKDYLEQNSC